MVLIRGKGVKNEELGSWLEKKEKRMWNCVEKKTRRVRICEVGRRKKEKRVKNCGVGWGKRRKEKNCGADWRKR